MSRSASARIFTMLLSFRPGAKAVQGRHRLAALPAMLIVLLLASAGCRHKEPPPAPPVSTAPPLPPSSMTQVQPLPSVPPAKEPKVGPPGSDEPEVKPVQTPPPAHKPRRTRKRPSAADAASAGTATPNSPSASAVPGATSNGSGAAAVPGTPPLPASGAAGSAAPAAGTTPPEGAPAAPPGTPETSLGQLSTGGAVDSRERDAMSRQIRTQESRLSGMKRPLSTEAETTAVQVRSFLIKARQALDDNDLDGARTLTTKAKVLLDELSGS